MPLKARALWSKVNSRCTSAGDKLLFKRSYPRLVKFLKWGHGTARAMQLAVGGEFEAIGQLELETLKHYGLQPDSYIVDVGCGSGRLAKPLSRYLTGRYLGTDIVPDLVEYARRLVARPDWRFEVVRDLVIPEKNGLVEFVCFFSVFTHLLHEQSFVYLREAKRVLKTGGKIVFSFLDFRIPEHWSVFEANIGDLAYNRQQLNMFICPDAIRAWCAHLDLSVEAIEDGNHAYVPLSRPIAFEDGTVVDRFGTIGQSVCVLVK